MSMENMVGMTHICLYNDRERGRGEGGRGEGGRREWEGGGDKQ